MPWWAWIIVGFAGMNLAYIVTPGFGFWDMGWEVAGPFALVIAPLVYVIYGPIRLARILFGVEHLKDESEQGDDWWEDEGPERVSQ